MELNTVSNWVNSPANPSNPTSPMNPMNQDNNSGSIEVNTWWEYALVYGLVGITAILLITLLVITVMMIIDFIKYR